MCNKRLLATSERLVTQEKGRKQSMVRDRKYRHQFPEAWPGTGEE